VEHLQKILFIDIETAPITAAYQELPEGLQQQWNRKSQSLRIPADETPDPAKIFQQKAGIYAEFAKIVCIGIGFLRQEANETWKLYVKSFTNRDERIILDEFLATLQKLSNKIPDFRFCGHNIREFDIPFICRRLVIHGIPLPACLQIQGKKPWEITHIDTLELWRFGDYKNYTSLALLAEVLGIPSPKEDIDGSMVGDVFWNENDLERISKYCLRDVDTTTRVYLHITGMRQIKPELHFL
jgi:hypothetical protein